MFSIFLSFPRYRSQIPADAARLPSDDSIDDFAPTTSVGKTLFAKVPSQEDGKKPAEKSYDDGAGAASKKYNVQKEVAPDAISFPKTQSILRAPDAISFPKTQSFAAGIPSTESHPDVSMWKHKTDPRDKGARALKTYRQMNK